MRINSRGQDVVRCQQPLATAEVGGSRDLGVSQKTLWKSLSCSSASLKLWKYGNIFCTYIDRKEKLCSLRVNEQEEGCGQVQSPSLVLSVQGVQEQESGQSPAQAGGVQAGAVSTFARCWSCGCWSGGCAVELNTACPSITRQVGREQKKG